MESDSPLEDLKRRELHDAEERLRAVDQGDQPEPFLVYCYATALAGVGRLREAEDETRNIGDESLRLDALILVARSLADAGSFDESLRILYRSTPQRGRRISSTWIV